MMNRYTPGSIQKQRGVALVVTLVFLLTLTLIGISAMQNTTLQERMAGNVALADQTFENAEATLREIEVMAQIAIEKGTTGGFTSLRWEDLATTLGLSASDCSGTAIFSAVDNGTYTIAWQTAPVTGGQYMIIDMGSAFNCIPGQNEKPGDPHHYLIAVRSVGPSGIASILESNFSIPLVNGRL